MTYVNNPPFDIINSPYDISTPEPSSALRYHRSCTITVGEHSLELLTPDAAASHVSSLSEELVCRDSEAVAPNLSEVTKASIINILLHLL
jgi:hypothetical protein